MNLLEVIGFPGDRPKEGDQPIQVVAPGPTSQVMTRFVEIKRKGFYPPGVGSVYLCKLDVIEIGINTQPPKPKIFQPKKGKNEKID